MKNILKVKTEPLASADSLPTGRQEVASPEDGQGGAVPVDSEFEKGYGGGTVASETKGVALNKA